MPTCDTAHRRGRPHLGEAEDSSTSTAVARWRRGSRPRAAIVAENAKTGHAWWVTTPQNAGDIEGYASQVSAVVGDTVTLFVSTKAAQFHVEAYRMGYYQGIGAPAGLAVGRGRRRPTAAADAHRRHQHHRMPLDALADRDHRPHLAPGRLPAEAGRHDRRAAVRPAVRAGRRLAGRHRHPAERDHLAGLQPLGRLQPLLRQPRTGRSPSPTPRPAAPTPTGPGSSPSTGPTTTTGRRAPPTSSATSSRWSSRPSSWASTSPTGPTSTCTPGPQLLANHRALISLGHDEYWSAADARRRRSRLVAGGVNLAFLGANACYRQIRFEPSPLGPNRHQVCYKSAAEDPMTGQNDALVTVNWAQPPVSRPESAADRQHLPGHRGQRRHGDRRPVLVGCSPGPG